MDTPYSATPPSICEPIQYTKDHPTKPKVCAKSLPIHLRIKKEGQFCRWSNFAFSPSNHCLVQIQTNIFARQKKKTTPFLQKFIFFAKYKNPQTKSILFYQFQYYNSCKHWFVIISTFIGNWNPNSFQIKSPFEMREEELCMPASS